MKKSLFVAVITAFALSIFAPSVKAQSAKEELDFFQSIFGMEKKAIVADFLSIKTDDAFWAIYDAYETERKALGQDRINALINYASNYDKMSADQYDAFITQMISFRKKTDKLTDTYYKKVKKASGSVVAAQFFQIEAYFTSQIRAAIMEEIPFLGEIEK